MATLQLSFRNLMEMRILVDQRRQLEEIMRKLDRLETVHRQKCFEPKKSLAFAKTHKTGSTTLQNIFMRFGVKHDLTFAFPEKSWMFSLVEPMNASLVLDGPWRNLGQFHLFLSHSKWRRQEVARIVQPDAPFVTILRDPIDCFESAYVFLGKAKALKADINQYAREYAAMNATRTRKSYVGQNMLLWDLGMDFETMGDADAVRAKIASVEDEFHLVMIMESFDESLVLLQELLCWPDGDMAYVRQMERLPSKRSNMTDETREILRRWLWADYMLYDHFVAWHRQRVIEFGEERMAERMKVLRAQNEMVEKECVERRADKAELSGEASNGPQTVFGLQTFEGRPWCWPFVRRETEFAKMIRQYQTDKVTALDKLRGVSSME